MQVKPPTHEGMCKLLGHISRNVSCYIKVGGELINLF